MRALSVTEMAAVSGGSKSNSELWNELKADASEAFSASKIGGFIGGAIGARFGQAKAGTAIGSSLAVIYTADKAQTAARERYENYSNEGRSWLSERGMGSGDFISIDSNRGDFGGGGGGGSMNHQYQMMLA